MKRAAKGGATRAERQILAHRARRGELFRAAVGARQAGDTEASVVWAGQSAGLITSIEAAGELIEQIVRDADRVIRERAELITARNRASP
jgi:NAD(P)H-dependent flavin oxidoreductase YrpB (nitropropane dioxygenase family)